MLMALPDDGEGRFGRAAVRYALHRLFVQRHGWFIEGLDSEGLAWIGTSPSQAVVQQSATPCIVFSFNVMVGLLRVWIRKGLRGLVRHLHKPSCSSPLRLASSFRSTSWLVY